MKLSYIKKYQYDSQNKLIQRSIYSMEDSFNESIIEGSPYSIDGILLDLALYKYDLNGRLIEEIFYNPLKDRRSKNEYKYDSRGNIIEEIEYDQDVMGDYTGIYQKQWVYDTDGFPLYEKFDSDYYPTSESVYRRRTYEYDSFGRLIRKNSQGGWEDFPYPGPYIYEYNHSGDTVHWTIPINNEIIHRGGIKKNSAGKIIEYFETLYENHKYKVSRRKYKYDQRVNLIEFISENDDVPYEKQVITYDLSGKKVEDCWYWYKSTKEGFVLRDKTQFEYDSNGNLILERICENDSDHQEYYHKTTFKYDSNNRLIERREYDSNRKLYNSEFTRYDTKGRKIEFIKEDNIKNKSERIVNKFDRIGNLIEIKFYDVDLFGVYAHPSGVLNSILGKLKGKTLISNFEIIHSLNR